MKPVFGFKGYYSPTCIRRDSAVRIYVHLRVLLKIKYRVNKYEVSRIGYGCHRSNSVWWGRRWRGGASTVGSGSVVAATAVLSSSNQQLASQETSSSSFLPLLGAQTLTGAQSTDESVLFNFARQQMDKLPGYIADAKANSVLTGVVQNQSVACSGGGSLLVSANDADNSSSASAGDSVTVTSNGCVEGAAMLSGSIGFVINSATGIFNSSNFSAGMTMNFGNFSVSSSQFAASLNGSLSFSINATGVNASTARLTTPSLAISATYAGVTRTRGLTNYSASYTRSPSQAYTYVTSYVLNGFLTSSSLSSQAIGFATPTPIITRYTDYYPSSGVLVISGANNTKVRLTAISNTQVSEELDANGDGIYESTALVAWNTLM